MNRRIFVAIDISDEAKRRVSEYSETLRREFSNLRVHWAATEKLHLTLKFLGDTNEKQLENLIEIVGKTAAQISNFKLRIDATGVFPNQRGAKILWLGAGDETGSLQKISEILENECVKIGFRKQSRKFKAHLTIARLREAHKSKEIVRRHLEKNFEPVEFEVSEIVIYESKLQPFGSIYLPVSKAKTRRA